MMNGFFFAVFYIIAGAKFKITAIGSGAFKDFVNLKKVTIGLNVTKIGSSAFKGCINLKNINIKSKKIKTFGAKSFKKINGNATIKTPKIKKNKYKRMIKKAGAPKSVKFK